MTRPTDWAPVADHDPAPGDTDAIRGQVVQLTRVADSILDQVAALKRIASAQQDKLLVGQFANTISSKAGELADHLGRAEGRYRTASSELKQWLSALKTAQSSSMTQLRNALTAQKAIDAIDPQFQTSQMFQGTEPFGAGPSLPAAPTPGPTRTPQQQQALTDARASLDAARREVARIQTDLDAEAAIRERNIKAACQDDGLKDSRWDIIKSQLKSGTLGRIVSDACNGLGWIATGMALVALCFPGVDLIALGALVATGLAMGGHTLLATAGAGSWTDVGLDAFAVLSFGAGAAVSKGLESGVMGLRTTLETTVATRTAAQFMELAMSDRGADAMLELTKGTDLARAADATLNLNAIFKQARPVAWNAKNVVMNAAKSKSEFKGWHFAWPTFDAFLQGSHNMVATRVWLKKVVDLAGDDPNVAWRVAQTTRRLNQAVGVYATATAVDFTDKIFGSTLPRYKNPNGITYNKFVRPSFTYTTGSSW